MDYLVLTQTGGILRPFGIVLGIIMNYIIGCRFDTTPVIKKSTPRCRFDTTRVIVLTTLLHYRGLVVAILHTVLDDFTLSEKVLLHEAVKDSLGVRPRHVQSRGDIVKRAVEV